MADSSVLAFTLKVLGTQQAAGDVGTFRAAVDKEMGAVEQSFVNSTGAVGRFSAALGPAGLAFGVVAGAAVTASTAIFGFAAKTADAEAKLWDMSQRTNFSVETLSALKIALENSGGSLDRFQQGLVFFQKNIEAANEGNKKLSATFKVLNIDTTDNETALRSAFVQLSKITDGTQQAALAQKLFRGSAKDVLGVIKESHGDFDAYTEKLRKLGILIGTEEAANADKFRDSLHFLSLEASSAGRQFADEVIPQITRAMEDLSGAMDSNGSIWQEWGKSVADATEFARVVIETLRELSKGDHKRYIGETFDEATRKVVRHDDIMSGRLDLPDDQLTPEEQEATHERSDRELRRAFAGAGMRWPTEGVDPSLLGGGKSGADKARNEAARKIEQQNKQIEEEYRRHVEELQRDFDRETVSSQTYTQKLIDEANDRYNKLKASLDKEAALYKPGTSGAEKVATEQQKALDERDKTVQAAKDAQEKREIDSLKAHREALLKLGETYDQEAIATVDSNAEAGAISYEEAENKKFDIQTKAFDRRLQALRDDEADFYATQKDINDVNKEQAQKYSDDIRQLEEQQEQNQQEHVRRTDEERQKDIQREREYRQQMKALRQQEEADELEIQRMEIEVASRSMRFQTPAQKRTIIKALADVDREAEDERHTQRLEAIKQEEEDAKKQAALHGQIFDEQKTFDRLREDEARKHLLIMGQIQQQQKDDEDATNPLKGAFDQLKQQTSFTDFLSTQAAQGLYKMRDAFGQAIEANILYGQSIGKALKAALAEYLAHVSAEATIEALRQAAWALASLAFGDFAGAAKHAAAAAAFGGLALVAGAAGSSLAKSAGLRGDSSTGTGSSAGSAVASTEGSSSSGTTVIEQSRTPPAPQSIIIHLEVHGKNEPGVLTDTIVKSIEQTSGARSAIVNVIHGEYDRNNPKLLNVLQGAQAR